MPANPPTTPVTLRPPPLPHAAADPAADAGERVELTESDIDIIEAGARVAGHVSAEAGAALIADWRRMRAAERAAYDLMMAAERDFVAMKTAAVQAVNDCAREFARAEAAEAERDRFSAELAAVRAALAEMVAARDFDGDPATYSDRIMRAWAGAERALATATATPRAAGTGMGGDGWTREAQRGQSGLYWLLLSGGDRPRLLDVFWPSDGPIVAGLGAPMPGDILLWGPPFTGEPPPGWREALATAMPTPTPPAAEAGTEFGRWIGPEEERVTRLLIHAAVQECDDEYGARPSDELIDAAQQYRAWEYEQPEPDQPQEADYAR